MMVPVVFAATTTRSACLTLVAATVAASSIVTLAQTFEVASIKLNKEQRGPLTSLEAPFYEGSMAVMQPGRFRLAAVPTRTLIQLAYGVREFQIAGEPSWVNDERYDVDARADGITTFDQVQPMLQALLADRFSLAVRHETRIGRVYELVPARDGLRITPTPPGGCYDPRSPSGPAPVFGGPLIQCGGVARRILAPPPDRQDRIEAIAVPMATLVDVVIAEVSRPVVDRTGFEPPFNFVLEFTPNVAASDYRGPSTLRDAGPSAALVPISTALQEQLGIQLRSAEAPVEIIVIDRIERPSEN